ncbi:hypothetical protein MTR_2g101440 [Medicago truncatula]|uniref:Uncharacterized protein n=1 Tax=Medicago truncatula TaxID=3880 RepID=G7IUN6_MEDTR|nr:hypothetical protein MTR_2g101440 [Medicago truncatula]
MTIDPNTNIFSIPTNQTKKKLHPSKRQQSPKSTVSRPVNRLSGQARLLNRPMKGHKPDSGLQNFS